LHREFRIESVDPSGNAPARNMLVRDAGSTTAARIGLNVELAPI
jgi:hypothetical protein